MLLVVFGAGASYDSAPSYPPQRGDGLIDRPPLASELFDLRPRFADAMRSFSRCQPLVPRLRHPAAGLTVEDLLQRFQAEASQYPERHSQLAAIRYYLQFVLWQIGNYWGDTHKGVTNYATLLDDIEHWRAETGERVCLVSFNYDTLLESALPRVRAPIGAIDDYVTDLNYKLIKVHGSVNWGHELAMEWSSLLEKGNDWQAAQEYIERAAHLTFVDQYHIVTSYPVARGETQGHRFPLFPAIALPVIRKKNFECPPRHLQALNECLPQVTRIVTIGWRANEQHFLDLLRANPGKEAKVMVIAGELTEAQQICLKLSAEGVGGEFHQGKDGFTAAVLNDEIIQFLARP